MLGVPVTTSDNTSAASIGPNPLIKSQGWHKRALARATHEFEALYNQRVAVQSASSRLNEHRSFSNVVVRRLDKVTYTCRYVGTSQQTFYRWNRRKKNTN